MDKDRNMSFLAKLLRTLSQRTVPHSAPKFNSGDGTGVRFIYHHQNDLILCPRVSTTLKGATPGASRLFHAASSLNFAPKSAEADHYETLGISPKASAEEIKSAFFELSKRHHPDVSNSEDALSDFLKIRAAYEVLGNAVKKRDYDRTRAKKLRQAKEEVAKGDDQEAGGSAKASAKSHSFNKRVVWRYREAEAEYNSKYKATEGTMHPKLRQWIISWLIFKEQVRNVYRIHHRAFLPFLALSLLIKIYYRYGCYWDDRTLERKKDLADSDLSHESWIEAEISRRWHWNENVDRLPEMLADERRKDQEKILERYKELNPDVDSEAEWDVEEKTEAEGAL